MPFNEHQRREAQEFIQRAQQAQKANEVYGQFHPKEIIQLTELAVWERLPPYANEDDMYASLDKCGMTVEEIFEELDRRISSGQVSDDTMELVIRSMLFVRFDERLIEVTAHKVSL
jgi:hypothetical protein